MAATSIVNSTCFVGKRVQVNGKQELSEVRGWLALLVVAMCLLGPLKTIGQNSNNITTAEKDVPSLLGMTEWLVYKQASWVFVGLVCVTLFFGGWKLWKRHQRSSVYLAIAALWIANFLALAGDYVVTNAILGPDVFVAAGGDYFLAIMQTFIAPVVWTAYLLLSRRVKNTYFSSTLH